MTNSFKRTLIRHAELSEARIIIIDKKNDRIMSIELEQDETDEYFDTSESHIKVSEKKIKKN